MPVSKISIVRKNVPENNDYLKADRKSAYHLSIKDSHCRTPEKHVSEVYKRTESLYLSVDSDKPKRRRMTPLRERESSGQFNTSWTYSTETDTDRLHLYQIEL
jgi:hypothetical protein